ncbi:V-type ATP synthase subunit I [Gracilinema caldarium]|uniref:V-type ATPase 116 kDa subunit n=1 Tax=Gracilinema caldarium (strain ATCC 51460 / DSM 7334 / H1) TaxID=744872 RepID=F8F3L4_GRAC1|nr:V-type ATPase 116kDa subunit family protein [Gracilinema caldarium]AEJ19958.1 V-type ATPase 116 kDa subunit [Gracilinema caldarium DSM 7334]
MIRPRPMKYVEIYVLSRDVDVVIEYLGRKEILHLSLDDTNQNVKYQDNADTLDQSEKIKKQLEKLEDLAGYLELFKQIQAAFSGELAQLPSDRDEQILESLSARIDSLRIRESEKTQQVNTLEETLHEARAFANLKAPFSNLDQLSYLTLRIGHLDPQGQEAISKVLGDRAVIIPLNDGNKVVVASSRKGRFALDTELKKVSFRPLSIPEGFSGVPEDLLEGLETSLQNNKQELASILAEKNAVSDELLPVLQRLYNNFTLASLVETLKSSLRASKNAYLLAGWVPASELNSMVRDLTALTDGRLSVRSFSPEERKKVLDGEEKVPVSLDHGNFVQGFQGVVFSYGAPLYGTIDPTPFVAFIFTLLFGIMFGDVGQGFVLFMLGLATSRKGIQALKRFRIYSTPLIAVGISSMLMGFLDGEVFANEELLIRPTRIITSVLTGHPVDRILTLMPEKGSMEKLFIFFGFTIGVGVLINSIGLVINIINQITLKNYEKAFFAKTGLAGALFFWYAIFMAVRVILGQSLHCFDVVALAVPPVFIFWGPVLYRLLTRKKPVMEHGFMVFFMEGFVEILETISTYVSNTVSFLRVGAFALSHAVLSFIVFTLSSMVAKQAIVGPVMGILVAVFGNLIIIVLEGMIVAIQVVRLQYYEFFSKFFTETGIRYKPFRFQREVEQ